MAFNVEEFQDLIRLLQERPEWRADLRRLVLTDELLALPELVRELVQAQQRTEVRVGRLEEALITLTEAQQRIESAGWAARGTCGKSEGGDGTSLPGIGHSAADADPTHG